MLPVKKTSHTLSPLLEIIVSVVLASLLTVLLQEFRPAVSIVARNTFFLTTAVALLLTLLVAWRK
jgi:hypothetical protein